MSNVSPLTGVFQNIQVELSRYLYIPLYIFGNIGNIFNLILFSQSKLRLLSVCSWYFLIVSSSNLIIINTGYLTRILTYLGYPDPSRTISFYCIGRVFIQSLMLTISRHFLCSILIDRYLVTSSSNKYRQLSSFKIGKIFVPLSILCWTIFYCHIWVGYSGIQPGSACRRQPGAYTLFITICSITIDATIPIILMIILSLLTLNNLHGLNQRRNRIIPITNGTDMIIFRSVTINTIIDKRRSLLREKKKLDKQLTLISLIQVVIYILFNTLNASFALYSFLTSSIVRSADRAAIESFISAFSVMLVLSYGSLNFYIYTIVSSTYRGEFVETLKRCFIFIKHQFESY